MRILLGLASSLQTLVRMNVDDRFQSLGLVAQSAMARAYLARDRQSGLRVALKVHDAAMDSPSRARSRARSPTFTREASFTAT